MNRQNLLRSYWDRNLDPFNWKRTREDHVASVWQKAVSTYVSPEVEYALNGVGVLQGKRLLLVGCGLGQGCLPLARMGAQITGVDISEERIRLARQLVSGCEEGESITLLVANAADLACGDMSFDIVLSQDVLMYSNPQEVIDECARVLVRGGRAVFIESLRDNPVSGWFRNRNKDNDTASLTHHLTWQELTTLVPSNCIRVKQKGFYLFAVIAFGILYLWRCVPLYRFSLWILNTLDNRLLSGHASLTRYAWKGVAVFERT